MSTKDYYPTKREDLPEFYQNFYTQLLLLAGKYSITGAMIDAIKDDKDWIIYWVPAIQEIENQVDALTGGDGYFNTILKEPAGTPPPSTVTIALPSGTPNEILPGARARVRDIANFIKGNPVYVKSDGELLSIVTSEPAPLNPIDLTADCKIRTMPGFALEATFSKQGQDAMRFEMRHKGGEWQFVTVLTSSPGTFVITPTTPGEAEQVEIRSIMIKKNQMIGNYSDIKTALIAP